MIRPFAAFLVVAGLAACTPVATRVEPSPRWLDAGTPQAPVAEERVTRYYVDETGAIWDDRGRKYDGAP